MHSFYELVQGCTSYTINVLNESQQAISDDLQTGAKTRSNVH